MRDGRETPESAFPTAGEGAPAAQPSILASLSGSRHGTPGRDAARPA